MKKTIPRSGKWIEKKKVPSYWGKFKDPQDITELARECYDFSPVDFNDLKRYLSDKNKNYRDSYGCTPLHYTARFCRIESTRLLLEKGADPNIKDMHGNTPLHECCRVVTTNCHIIAELLLKNGADYLIKNNEGKYPMDLMKESGNNLLKKVFENRYRKHGWR